jgi:hypothetical protein
LSQAPPERSGAAEPRAALANTPGALASLVDESAGLTGEVVQAKLQLAELEAPGPRLPADVPLLRKLHSSLDSPPPGIPEADELWGDYLSYRQRRLTELEQGRPVQGPLRWEAYERMRGAFARGLAFERSMVDLLREDAALPPVQRRWLKGFSKPRIETHVGLSKQGVSGVRFADVLVVEQQPPAGQPPRVETFSFKSRYLAPLKPESLAAQLQADAHAALDYYGGTVDILRPTLKRRVQVQHIRLVYQSGGLMPETPGRLETAVNKVNASIKGVEVLVQ